MSVTGLCEICERPSVEHTCDRCGQLVCDRHFDEGQGICAECVADLGPMEQDQPTSEDLPDGVDTYRY